MSTFDACGSDFAYPIYSNRELRTTVDLLGSPSRWGSRERRSRGLAVPSLEAGSRSRTA